MPGGRPRLTASEHWRLGTYRRDRHGPLPWDRPAFEPEPIAEGVPTPADSVWKHELRLLRFPGETLEQIMAEAMEYRDKRRRDGLKANSRPEEVS